MATTPDRERIPLMLIHGAWLAANSWDNFADYFENRGFAVSAPEWPRKHGDVEQLRQEAEEIKGLGLEEIATTTRNGSARSRSHPSSSAIHSEV